MDIGIYTWFGFRYPFDEIIAEQAVLMAQKVYDFCTAKVQGN